MVPRVSRPRPLKTVRVGWAFLFAVTAAGAATTVPACTLFLDASSAQCNRPEDCARFPGTGCDSARHVCVPTTRTPIGRDTDGGANDAASAGADASFLFCPPDSAAAPGLELLNACTNASCIPFDNRARLRNLTDDGSLKPLPEVGGVVPPP
jgi:hypothetical protein